MMYIKMLIAIACLYFTVFCDHPVMSFDGKGRTRAILSNPFVPSHLYIKSKDNIRTAALSNAVINDDDSIARSILDNTMDVEDVGDVVTYQPTSRVAITAEKTTAKPRWVSKRELNVTDNDISELSSGDFPNVHWRAIPMQHLRQHPLFTALPHPDIVTISTLQDLSLFRQDSWQWDALHQGRLTTSRLAACLGFYEKSAAAYLNIPASLTGHDRVVHAFEHLRQHTPLSYHFLQGKHRYQPGAASGRSVWQEVEQEGGGGGGGAEEERAACYYSHEYKPSDSDADGGGYGSRRLDSPQQTRMVWGSTQEATAILAVVNYLHCHQLQEATAVTCSNSNSRTRIEVKESGMLTFEALLTGSSDYHPYLNPGDTQDTTTTTTTSAETLHIADKANTNFTTPSKRSRGSSSKRPRKTQHPHGPPLPGQGAEAEEEAAAAAGGGENLQLRPFPSSSLTLPSAAENSSSSINWPTTFTVSSLYSFLAQLIYHQRALPLLGASPDALIEYHRMGDTNDGSGDNSTGSWLEVVEVKCFSPFVRQQQRSGPSNQKKKKKSMTISFARPPQDGVPVWHFPQIQMEILCAGPRCQSALLTVLYARGARLYRIERDLQYQARMMELLSDYYLTYHRRPAKHRQKPPPINFFEASGRNGSRYRSFLDETKRLASQARLVADLSQVQRSPLNGHFFWDELSPATDRGREGEDD